MKTRKLASMAILIALSVVLVAIIHFPIFPSASFLEYDPADIPILICGFAFGPVAGICVTVVAATIQGLTVSASGGWYGIVMHIISTGTLVTVSSLIYKSHKTKKGAVAALIAGTLAMGLIMMPANYFITPLYFGMPREYVVPMLLPVILPFNLIKAGANSLITFFVYKSVSKLIHRFDGDEVRTDAK